MPRTKTKGRRGEKSQAVRAYFADHPNARPSEVVVALKVQGIAVRPQLVSTIKGKLRGKKGRKVAARQAGHTRGSLSLTDVLAAKQLADRLGSIERAKEALGALEQLR